MILVEKLKNWNFESSKNHFFENLAWLIDNFCVELFWLLIIESGILKGKFMRELVIDIPLENVKDEKLFEYKSFYIKSNMILITLIYQISLDLISKRLYL